MKSSLQVGSHEFKDPLVYFVRPFDTANLGSKALQNFKLTFDMRNSRVKIAKETEGPIPPDNVYRVGIRMGNAEGGVRVDEVTTGSAAELGGFKAGDLIVSINGRDAIKMSERERRMICAQPKPIQFDIQRGDENLELKITPANVYD